MIEIWETCLNLAVYFDFKPKKRYSRKLVGVFVFQPILEPILTAAQILLFVFSCLLVLLVLLVLFLCKLLFMLLLCKLLFVLFMCV